MPNSDDISAGDLEVFRHALRSVVEEMGVTLQRTAYSTNIKIRKDHTCAIFDADVRHIGQHAVAPQHIMAMVRVIPLIVEQYEDDLQPGDGILLNDPYMGAVHLPDIFVISPMFYDGEIIGYAANSAHHVDVGGKSAGSIPSSSTELYEEGLVIPGVKAIRDWEYDENIMELILRNVRVSKMRHGDYQAQLSANKIAEERYRDLVEDRGARAVEQYLDELLDYTEERVRSAISALPDGTYEAETYLDGDAVKREPVKLKLSLIVDDDEMTIDFTGTDPENPGSLNGLPPTMYAGTLSTILSLIAADLPKNQGFHRPFSLITPEGSMVNPSWNQPIAGTWEVAMRAADLVTKAMADAIPRETIAATKGMVCNLSFGGVDPRNDEDYVFMETVGGGYGARYLRDGLDGVQCHFQNTANSPIEELESEIPVYIRRYEFIQDSDGAGRTRGGLGIRRDYEFYDHSASFSVLSDRTRPETAPWGLFGGHEGRTARFVVNPDGDSPRELFSKTTETLEPGDVMSIQTPGGGGYGDPNERDPGKVREDVLLEKVSAERARTEYGVDPSTPADAESAEDDRRSTTAST